MNLYCECGRRALTIRAEARVGIRRGDGCCHRGPFFTGSSRKSIRTFVGKRQARTVIRFVAMRMSLCSHGLHFAYSLKTSRIHKRETERARKKAVTLHSRKRLLIWQAPTYAESLFKLSSGCLSFLKRRIIRKRLPSIYHITMSIPSSVFLFTCDFRRESFRVYQNSIAPVM